MHALQNDRLKTVLYKRSGIDGSRQQRHDVCSWSGASGTYLLRPHTTPKSQLAQGIFPHRIHEYQNACNVPMEGRKHLKGKAM